MIPTRFKSVENYRRTEILIIGYIFALFSLNVLLNIDVVLMFSMVPPALLLHFLFLPLEQSDSILHYNSIN